MSKDIAILDMSNDATYQLALNAVKDSRGKGLYWWTLRRCRSQRSLNQNAFMWGIILPRIAAGMTDAFGEVITVDDAHEFCKAEFLSRRVTNRETGETGIIPGSSAALKVDEFSQYLEKLIKFAMELGCQDIPMVDSFSRKLPPDPGDQSDCMSPIMPNPEE